MTAMLASVRSLAEAEIVARAGVDWIDLKEPAAGALGAVDRAVVRAVAEAHGTRHRISATIGDCWDTPALIPEGVAAMSAAGAQFVKVGAYAASPPPQLLDALRAACAPPARVIVVCFAEAPPTPADVRRLAATGIVGVMLDTALKQGPRLRELLAPDALAAFIAAARACGLLSGLAGRLRADDVTPLRALAPDYLGFRGALCGAGERTAEIDAVRVADIRHRVAHAPSIPYEENSHGLA